MARFYLLLAACLAVAVVQPGLCRPVQDAGSAGQLIEEVANVSSSNCSDVSIVGCAKCSSDGKCQACASGFKLRSDGSAQCEPDQVLSARAASGVPKPVAATNATTNATAITAKAAGCSDRSSWCSSWKASGYCASQWVYEGQRVGSYWCPQTCGACSGTCSDRLTCCSSWKASGYCGDQWYYQNQQVSTQWCPSTCGKCSNSGSTNGWQTQLLNLVNDARARSGLGRLCLNTKLNNAAQAHSQDQANRRTMSHTGGDGSSVSTRVSRAGYSWRAVGENVAWNYPDVQAVFNGWMNSPGHRANILSGNYQHMGAGRADSNGPYWTQVFGASNSDGCS